MPHPLTDSSSGPDGSPGGALNFPILNAALLGLTLITTTFWGAAQFGRFAEPPAGFLELFQRAFTLHYVTEGLFFSVPLLVILGCHEAGHYLACRRHGLDATLPFFIPAPIGIGTFGALIRIRSPIATRRQLLEVGAAGPIAGFLALLPFLAYGIANATVVEISPELVGMAMVFDEPLIFDLFQHLFGVSLEAGADINLHPAGWAAWCGLLLTLLNLLPFAQLDGGHVCHALFGRWHSRVVWLLLVVLYCLGFFWWGWWLWTVIVVVLGVEHPPVADDGPGLGAREIAVGVIAILIFVLCFMPAPIRLVG